jgi:hypothetical protein
MSIIALKLTNLNNRVNLALLDEEVLECSK